uniref:MATE efflux family protein n=1 Tax=Arcella intermedia TaxID=1963864 RepID=A0A6B2L4B4_9EUKA
MMDTAFIGRIGELELAGAALGSSWSICLTYIPTGLSNGLDTLASQAFGAGNLPLVGVWFQVSLWLSFLFSIPVLILLYFTEPIMVSLGQELTVAHLSGQYAKWLIPGIVPFVLFNCQMRWLQNQQIMYPANIIAVAGILLNFPLNYVCIWGAGSWHGWGLEGAAIATSVLRILMPIATWGIVLVRKLHLPTSSKIYKDAFKLQTVIEFLRYGVPAMLMVFFEVAGFEASTILVGLLLQPAALAAHGIGLYSLLLNFIIPFGWGIAANVQLGNIVGGGDYERARRVAFFSIIVIVVQMFIHSFIWWSCRSYIVSIWSTTPDVHAIGVDIVAIAALVVIFDGYQFTAGSLIKAIGRQFAGGIVHFVGFYVISLPGGYIFASVLGFGVKAYWWSLATCIAFLCIGFTTILLRVDWKEETMLAQKRTQYEVLESDEEEIIKVKPN